MGRWSFARISAARRLWPGFQQIENAVWRDGKLQPNEPGRPAVAVVEMSSPYVVTKASGSVACEGAKAEVSKDGKAWTAVELREFSAAVRGCYRYQLRITFSQPLAALEITSVVQHNQEALPYLAPGRNKITVTAANPQSLGDNRLVVTYAYCLGARDLTPEQVFERDAEIARAHFATWSDQPIVVQQTISQLPATIEIPVPTPRGKQPVYPRMLFLRRELLAPGQSPLPRSRGTEHPGGRRGRVLADVPNPWRIGTGKPPDGGPASDHRPGLPCRPRLVRVEEAAKRFRIASSSGSRTTPTPGSCWPISA